MKLPKELLELPSINIVITIDGEKSQVFFDFDKSLTKKTQEEVEQFLIENKIDKLLEEFKQVLKTFLREL